MFAKSQCFLWTVLLLAGAPTLLGCSFNHSIPARQEQVRPLPTLFTEVTSLVGLKTIPAWKYGGPTVADLDSDGRYDLVLGNHNQTPAYLFWASDDNRYSQHKAAIARGDLHGLAAGDYDLDGDLDIVYLLGGGNGQKPQPPRLLRNENGEFSDVTQDVGISGMGARGRSPRWIDLNSDGYLDLLLINAAQVIGEGGPRNIIFENQKDGSFLYRSSPQIEQLDAERALITDFNGDHIPDLVAFSPLSLLRGNNDFTFTDMTRELLPENLWDLDFVNAVAEADIDNDGDLDLYLARGKTHYQTANNAISFNPETRRLDLRDEGNKGHDGISFKGSDILQLSGFWHWPRGVELDLPIYLGRAKLKINTAAVKTNVFAEQAKGFPESIEENGWFIGYLGNGLWRMEWNLNDNLAWGLRASLTGVDAIMPDWIPQQLGVADVLLRNDGNEFADISTVLPRETQDNNWGITSGDFNNDGLNDFFVYRFGELVWRKSDILLTNLNGHNFAASSDHGANVLPEKSHGDMGSAFDYNLDGHLDLLSGDDDNGLWRLYRNNGVESGNYLLIHVLYSKSGVDPMGAEILLTSASGKQFKRIGSAGAAHSQSQLNIAHFGLGSDDKVEKISVRWRDGTIEQRTGLVVNQNIVIGRAVK